METKIQLYDSNGNKMGETYLRRAKQLVKQQRAVWTDEFETAIQFMPGSEAYDVHELPDRAPKFVSAPRITPKPMAEDSNLVALAIKRIQQKRFFIWHTILFLPAWLVLVILADTMIRNDVAAMAFVTGSMFTAYGIHFFHFVIPRMRAFSITGSRAAERRARRLALEVASIKAELNNAA